MSLFETVKETIQLLFVGIGISVSSIVVFFITVYITDIINKQFLTNNN